MGLLSSQWEADHEGHHFTVTRSEVSRGFKLEYDGQLVSKKSWSLIGLGELEGAIEIDGHDVPVHVSLDLGSKCTILVGGKEIPVRTVK